MGTMIDDGDRDDDSNYPSLLGDETLTMVIFPYYIQLKSIRYNKGK